MKLNAMEGRMEAQVAAQDDMQLKVQMLGSGISGRQLFKAWRFMWAHCEIFLIVQTAVW